MRTGRILALLLAVGCGGGAPAPAKKLGDNWATPTEPFRIIGELYYVGTEGLAAYLFVTPKGHILIDGGTPAAAALIEASIRRLGFEVEDVEILLNSHAHYDHSGGLAQLKRDSGAALYAMEGDRSALEGGFYLGSEDDASMGAPPVAVDRALHDGEVVELGGTRLVAHHTPGHSRGCTSWGFTIDGHEGLVFCSATVAANRITPPLQYDGIVEDYRRTFAKVKAMKVDIPLAPHPELFDELAKRARAKAAPGGPNPFVAPGELGPFIEEAEAAFERTLAERRR
jgi:metallo-beta-lactamase class B